MTIIPVTAYEQMWDQAGNSSVTMTTNKIYTWTVAIQSPPPTASLPALPPEQCSGYNDLAVQIGRAQSDLDSASRSGYRFVGRWAQDANPVTAESQLWYTYQASPTTGKYLVNFFYPVTTAVLPKQVDMTTADWDKFNTDPQGYIKAQAEMLNALAPADWQPDLSQLDAWWAHCASMGCRFGPPRCRVAVDGSTYQGKENPIADPALYEVGVRLRRHVEREGGLQSGEAANTPMTAGWSAWCPGQDGTHHPGRLRPRLPLGGVDQQPHGRGRTTTCAARRQRVEAQHARRRSRLELPGQ